MNAKYRWIGTGLLSTSLAAVLVAQAPAMNVRMGLWEVWQVNPNPIQGNRGTMDETVNREERTHHCIQGSL